MVWIKLISGQSVKLSNKIKASSRHMGHGYDFFFRFFFTENLLLKFLKVHSNSMFLNYSRTVHS